MATERWAQGRERTGGRARGTNDDNGKQGKRGLRITKARISCRVTYWSGGGGGGRGLRYDTFSTTRRPCTKRHHPPHCLDGFAETTAACSLVLWYPLSSVAALWLVVKVSLHHIWQTLSPAWVMEISPRRSEDIRRASKQQIQ